MMSKFFVRCVITAPTSDISLVVITFFLINSLYFLIKFLQNFLTFQQNFKSNFFGGISEDAV